MPYRGVIFDLYGTLIDGWDVRQAAERTEELAATLGVPLEPFQELMEETYTERATAAMGDLPEMVRELCRRVGWTPDDETIARAVALRLQQFGEVLGTPREETPSVLATLRDRGVRLGLITDCSSETPELFPQLAWAAPLQVAIFSWSEGRRKPDPELYLKALTQLGLAAAECLYVGDGGSQELSGAEAVGIRALRVVHHPGSPERHLQYDPDLIWEGAEVSTLTEILPLLQVGPVPLAVPASAHS